MAIDGRATGLTVLRICIGIFFIFEGIGKQSFHLQWLRPAVFASVLWTDPDRPSFRRDYQNVGAQVDLHFSVLHWYDMTLSAGIAAGFREGRRTGEEWMVSLKIM